MYCVFIFYFIFNLLPRTDVCLSGGAAAAERAAALHALDASDEQTFVIVFAQDRALRFKGVLSR